MKKKKVILVILICIVLFVLIGFGMLTFINNYRKKKEFEKWEIEQQQEYERRNVELYDKYNGCWYSEEDDRLYFKLYKDEEGYMCLTSTSIAYDGTVAECSFRNVSLYEGISSMTDDGNIYFQVYYDGDCGAGGWLEFLVFENDDSKLEYMGELYYRH